MGQAKNTGIPEKFFIYSGGALTFLVPDGWLSALALKINNRGDIAGYGVPTLTGNSEALFTAMGHIHLCPHQHGQIHGLLRPVSMT